jgi:hypothetical protein
VFSNIHWQWTPNPYVATLYGIGAAWFTTVAIVAILEWLVRRSRRAPPTALAEAPAVSNPVTEPDALVFGFDKAGEPVRLPPYSPFAELVKASARDSPSPLAASSCTFGAPDSQCGLFLIDRIER